jgi:hypothetical protein
MMSPADSNEFVKAQSNMAMALTCKTAIEVLQDLGVKGLPSCVELHKLIADQVFPQDDDYSLSPKSSPREDITAKIDEVEPAVAEEPTKELTKEPTKELTKTMTAKFASKDLKKNPLKIAKKELNDKGEEVEVEVAFPYVPGFDYSSTCQSIKVNGGLFTPCMTRKSGSLDFCKSCIKGGHKDGIMDQRSNCAMLCYENQKGKKEITFGTWLMKRGLERDDVETKFYEHYGIGLPEEYWKLDKSKASRAVKTVSTSSDDEASVEGDKPAPKKRGRPKKSKKSDEASDSPSSNGDNVEPDEETKSNSDKVDEAKPIAKVNADELAEEPFSEDEAEKPLETEAEKPVETETEKPVETDAEKPVETEAEKPAEEEAEKPVETEAEKPVETEAEKPVETEAEKPVETEKSEEIKKKNGFFKKLEDDRLLVWWEDTTYIIDCDDNCVWTHDTKYEIVACVGEWDPETKEVKLD